MQEKKKTTFEVKVGEDTLRFFTDEKRDMDEKRVIFGYTGEKTHGLSVISPTEASTHQGTYEKGKLPQHQNILPSTNPGAILASVAKDVQENVLKEEYLGHDLRLFTKMDELRALFEPVSIEKDGKVVQQKDIIQVINGMFSIMIQFLENPGTYIDVSKLADYEGKALVNEEFQFFVVLQGKVLKYDEVGFGKMMSQMTLGKLSGTSFMMSQDVLKQFLEKAEKNVDPKAIFPQELFEENEK